MKITTYNYSILKEYILKHGDEIVFLEEKPELAYVVRESWLGRFNSGLEIEIFNILKDKFLLEENHIDFCKKAYGYEPHVSSKNSWPDCKTNDYLALTRVVYAIFKLLESDIKISTIELTEIPNLSLLC